MAYVICFVVVVVVVVVNLFVSSGLVLLLLLHYGHSVVPFVCLNVLSKKKKIYKKNASCDSCGYLHDSTPFFFRFGTDVLVF